MTNIEKALLQDDEFVDIYMSETSVKQFRKDVEELKKAYTNKELLNRIIEELEKLK